MQKYGLDIAKEHKRSLRVPIFFLSSFLVLVAALTVASNYVASKAGYHQRLGAPLFAGIYAPWSLMQWEPYITHGLFLRAVKLAIISWAVPHIVFFIVVIHNLKPKSIKDLHGSARWANLDEIEKMGLTAGQGVYIGGWYNKQNGMLIYLRHDGPEHILCFAPTRSGKGVGLIIPTLLSWGGSSLVFDIKGENYALTAGYLKSIGHVVIKLNFADTTGLAASFNPFAEIRLDTPKAIPDVQNIVQLIIDPDGKGLDTHWLKAGASFMSGALLHTLVKIRHEEKRSACLYDLALALANEEQSSQDFFEEMLETDHASMMQEMFDIPDDEALAIHKFIAASAREMLSKAEGESSGVVGTVNGVLGLYKDPIIGKNTRHSDFRIADLMDHEKPVNLYLVVSPADRKRLRPLIRLIISLILDRRTEKMEFAEGKSIASYKHRLLMQLDELPTLGKIDSIEGAIAYCAGYGIKLYIIVQDLGQLNTVYGKDNAIMGNCHIKIAYAPNNIETARLLSDMTGKTTIIQEKLSLSGKRSAIQKSASKSIQETQRPLLTPDEVMRLPGLEKDSQGRVNSPGHMLIFIAGQSPIYGMQSLYFKDPVFMERAKMPAPEESDSLSTVSTNTQAEQIEKPSLPQQNKPSFLNYLGKP